MFAGMSEVLTCVLTGGWNSAKLGQFVWQVLPRNYNEGHPSCSLAVLSVWEGLHVLFSGVEGGGAGPRLYCFQE